MKRTRSLSLILALTLLLSVFSACAPAEENEGATTPSTDSTATTSTATDEADSFGGYPIEGDVTLTYWLPLVPNLAQMVSNWGEAPVMEAATEQTGVTIEFIHPAIGMEAEDFNLMIASSDLPDIIGAPTRYEGGEFQGMYDGIFMELQDMIPTYAPDFYSILQTDEMFAREVSDQDGKIPAIASYKPFGDPDWMYLAFQQDVLDQIGLDVPVYLEDYEAVFEGMLDLGITPYMLTSTGYEPSFINLFGVHVGTDKLYQDLDGTVLYAPTQDGFLEYLTLMNDWYNKGYISKDFAATSGSQADTMFDTQQIGTYKTPCVAVYNRTSGQGIEATIAPPPRLEEGQDLHYSDVFIATTQPSENTKAAISKDCENVEAALSYLNYFYTDEGYELANWGVEGLNFDVTDDGNVYNDTMLKNDALDPEGLNYYYKLHLWPKHSGLDVEVHANLLKSPGALEIRMRYAGDENFDSAFVLPNLRLTDEELSDRTDILSAANTYVDEMTLKFITGATPLSEWDSYVATLEGMDVQAAVDITQVALDRYMGN